MKPVTFLPVLALPILLAFALSSHPYQKKPWPVPDAAKAKKNPVASTPASFAAGKTLWDTHCKSCHGAKGLGDGTKAAQLDTEPGDFSKNEFHAQSDGSLFYKISEGRGDMPGYKKKIPAPDDLWKLVNFMRTFKKGGAVVTPVKDTVAKKPEKPPVLNTPPDKKDTIAKKEVPDISKVEPLSLQEQINRLVARIDSLEKELNALKMKTDTLLKK